ncbi:MAG: porin family protein [Alphaproteobacteria bacterium]|nr:porin family protein [Alphaproteobacteria bacterium]
MKHYLIALTAFAAIVSIPSLSASAATDWSGFYAGLNAGGSFSSADAKTTVEDQFDYFAASSVTSINDNGAHTLKQDNFTGGAQAGVNFQDGNFVYGFEADFGAFNAADSHSVTATYPCCGPDTYTLRQEVDTSWLLTVRPRIGWAMDNILIYGTGGISVSNVSAKETFTDTFGPAVETSSKSDTKTGWNLGAGAEVAMEDGWSVRGEYLYTDLGKVSSRSTNLDDGGGPYTDVFHNSADLTSSIARLGVNRKF